MTNTYDAICTCGDRVKVGQGVLLKQGREWITLCKDCNDGEGDDMSDPKTIQEALTRLVPNEATVLSIMDEVGKDADGKDVPLKAIQFGIHRVAKPLAISPPKNHQFQAVAGFVKYLTKYGGANTVVLCDVQTGRCSAVLDEKAEKGFEVVTFTPQLHPTFAQWNAMIGLRKPILELASFIQKQRRAIDNGAELCKLMRQIKASVSIEAQEGAGNGKVNGIMTSVKIQGIMDKKPVELPETITITTPLFIDSEKPASLELDLVLDASSDGKQVTATLTAPTLDVVRFEELKEYANKFGAFTFAFGTPQHGAWKFID